MVTRVVCMAALLRQTIHTTVLRQTQPPMPLDAAPLGLGNPDWFHRNIGWFKPSSPNSVSQAVRRWRWPGLRSKVFVELAGSLFDEACGAPVLVRQTLPPLDVRRTARWIAM